MILNKMIESVQDQWHRGIDVAQWIATAAIRDRFPPWRVGKLGKQSLLAMVASGTAVCWPTIPQRHFIINSTSGKTRSLCKHFPYKNRCKYFLFEIACNSSSKAKRRKKTFLPLRVPHFLPITVNLRPLVTITYETCY